MTRRPIVSWVAAALLASASLTGCSSSSSPGSNTETSGSVQLQLQASDDVFLDSVHYAITGPNGFKKSGSLDLSRSSSLNGRIHGIPLGSGYTITLDAIGREDSATCHASADFDILSPGTTQLAVVLQCKVGPVRKGELVVNGEVNVCPVIDTATAPLVEINVGASLELSASGHDPDIGPEPLSYSWSASSGTLSDATNANPTFTCSEVGTATLTLELSDDDCSDQRSFEVICAEPTAPGETLILEEDFEGRTTLPEGWAVHNGEWSVQDGKLWQTATVDLTNPSCASNCNPAVVTFGPRLESFRFEATLQFTGGTRSYSWSGMGIDVHGLYPFSQAGVKRNATNSNGLDFAHRTDTGAWSSENVTLAGPRTLNDGSPVRLALEVRGQNAVLYFDGQKVLEYDKVWRSSDGQFGVLFGDGATGNFDDIRITKLNNICPVIDANELLTEVSVGASVEFPAPASDPDSGPDALSYSWSASSGTFDDPSSDAPSYTCTRPGRPDVTVAVSDGSCQSYQKFTVRCFAPNAPVAVTGPTTTLSLDIDPAAAASTVTFYGRKTVPTTPGPDFTIATLPDTQFYSANQQNRGSIYSAQTQWLAENHDTPGLPNLAFVSHQGDIVDNGKDPAQWVVADAAMQILEGPANSLRAFGIPWGGAPGNHDQSANGTAGLPNEYYNYYFSAERFLGRDYWGESQSPLNNHNNYQIFSASGLDFIIFHLEYDARDLSYYQHILDWVDTVMKVYPERRAIVTTHYMISPGYPASFSRQGQNIYDALKDNPNLFLLLGGHVCEEGRREDTYEGRTVYSILQDYQCRVNGGDGWLRYYVFSPANNTIRAKTYRVAHPLTPLDAFETDEDSDFILPYDMQSPVSGFIELGTASVPAGATAASYEWNGLERSSDYEWYAVVSDGTNTVTAPTRRFATAAPVPPLVALTAPAEGDSVNLPATISLAATASDDGSVAKVEFFDGSFKIGEDLEAPYSLAWSTATAGRHVLTAVATDDSGAHSLSNAVTISVSAQ